MLWFAFSIELGVNVMRAPQDGLRSMTSIPPQFASTFFFALAGDNARSNPHIPVGRALVACLVSRDTALDAITTGYFEFVTQIASRIGRQFGQGNPPSHSECCAYNKA